LPDDTAETTKDLPLRMSGLQDMIWTWDMLNIMEYYPLICSLKAFISMQRGKAFIYMVRVVTNLIIFLQKETTEIWATQSQRKDSVHFHMVRAYHISTILVPKS
jgi:hypothetical protein